MMTVRRWVTEDVERGFTNRLDLQEALGQVLLDLWNRVWAISRVEPSDLIDDNVWLNQKDDIHILLAWLRDNQGELDDGVTGYAMTTINQALVVLPRALAEAESRWDPERHFGIFPTHRLTQEVMFAWFDHGSSPEGAWHLINHALWVMARCYGQWVYRDDLVDPMFIFNEYMYRWREEELGWAAFDPSQVDHGESIAKAIRRARNIVEPDLIDPQWDPHRCKEVSERLQDLLALLVADGSSFDEWTVRMSREYDRRAELAREATEVDIDERLPTISVTRADGDEYFFQGEEAQAMLDEVPEWTDPWTYFMVVSQEW